MVTCFVLYFVQYEHIAKKPTRQVANSKVHDYVLNLMYESYDSEKNDDREKEVTDD